MSEDVPHDDVSGDHDAPAADPAAERGAGGGDAASGSAATGGENEPAVTDGPAEAGSGAGSETDAAQPRQHDRAKTKRSWARRLELPILVVVAVAIAIIVKTFVAQPFYIPSDSMERTLHGCTGCRGDRILVFKPVYHLHSPRPGDIVVFKNPDTWQENSSELPPQLSGNPVVHALQRFGQLVGVIPPSEEDLVKRVIAVGGQTIKCCDAQGNLQVSDDGGKTYRSLHEPYVYQNLPLTAGGPVGSAADDGRAFGPITVPKGKLWVMGDHRSDSADSLYQYRHVTNQDASASAVSVGNVIGKAVVIAWPPSRWRTLGTPQTFTSAAAPITTSPAAPPVITAAGVLVFGGVRRRRRRRRNR